VQNAADGYASPEEGALAGWPDKATVRVLSVDVRGDRAEVVVDTDPSNPYWVYCMRVDGRWHATVSGNGPTVGWDNPDFIRWGG
jgi:hypothetical protein